MIPRATYRLQFHKGFTFADAAPLAPYLARLGISHVYASPIGVARAGSMHGYDQVDPTRINPELGGEDGFRGLVAALKAEGLGVILDIVPNHMAVGGGDNRWWLDVLKHGEASAYAQMFDIDWRPADPSLHGKLLAPFLGAPYAEALADGDLTVQQDAASGEAAVTAYGAHRFPIRPQDQAAVRQGLTEPGGFDGKHGEGRARLHALLQRQHYRLAWWRTAGDEINWRRFFDVIELAGVRVERPEVYDLIHALPLRLYGEGLIDGLRVDHVDGLADPAAYCRTLRQSLQTAAAARPADAPGGPAYFVVEKILAPGERLPPAWLTDGTTGYDFMNAVAAVLHDQTGEPELSRHWAEISGRPATFAEEDEQARLEVLDRSFCGQGEAAVAAFHRLAQSDLATRDVTAGALRRALTALLSVFPAYRSYATGAGGTEADAALLATAAARAAPLAAPGEAALLDRLVSWIMGEGPGDPALRAEAARRFQQLSAPLSAKAVEDTAFYRYGRLLSRNDVGFDPGRLAASVADFHKANSARAVAYPHAMLTTATHDHKRGEDVRARLAVLSEFPERWTARAAHWARINAALGEAIDPADAYQLYQTLVGAWPLDLHTDDSAGLAAFADRVAGWQQKALREAKLRSSWAAPDKAYEAVCNRFLEALLDPGQSHDFRADLTGFVDQIAPAGALNGLVQTLLRCTAPGLPDTYQGCEFWDLSLVDPDNRRPVDFAARQAAIAEDLSPAALSPTWRDGRVKQALLARLLKLRAAKAGLFADGDYQPLQINGARQGRLIAFVRRCGADAVVVAAPLHCAEGVGRQPAIPSQWWGDTTIEIPERLKGAPMRDMVSGEIHALGERIDVAALFAAFPSAVLVTTAET